MGKSSFSFRRSVSRRRTKKTTAPPPRRSPPQPPYAAGITASLDGAANNGLVAGAGAIALTKVKKKTGIARLWMRFDRSGRSELVEWEKNAIVHHAAIPARDLRILGPVFSHSSNILATIVDSEISLLVIDDRNILRRSLNNSKFGLQVLDLIQCGSLKPDRSLYNTLLKRCTQLGKLKEGKLVHFHILNSEFKDDLVIQNSVLFMYARCGSLDDARCLY